LILEVLAQYRSLLASLLDASGGKQIKQIAMLAGFEAWNADTKLEFTSEELEAGAYKVRVMISQMSNHKKKNRGIPKAYKKQCQPLMDRLDFTEDKICDRGDDDDDDDDEGEGEVQIVEKHASANDGDDEDDAVSIASSHDIDTGLLFSSPNASLHALLRGVDEVIEPVRVARRRLSTKTTVASILPPPPGATEDTEALKDTAVFMPTAWLQTFGAKKGDKKKPDKATGKDKAALRLTRRRKAKLARASDPADKPEKKSSVPRLKYSKAYHRELKYCKKDLGMDEDAAKIRARLAGTKALTMP
jgi:hypothetical protein